MLSLRAGIPPKMRQISDFDQFWIFVSSYPANHSLLNGGFDFCIFAFFAVLRAKRVNDARLVKPAMRACKAVFSYFMFCRSFKFAGTLPRKLLIRNGSNFQGGCSYVQRRSQT